MLLERLERQQYILAHHAPDPPTIWFGLLAALLDLVKPVLANQHGRRQSPPLLKDICTLLGHAPVQADLAEMDVATQMLQIVSQMLVLSASYANLDSVQRLARQNTIASSVIVVHCKLLEICENLQEEEYRALRRLFTLLFGVYHTPAASSRFASASNQRTEPPSSEETRGAKTRASNYGTMNTHPRARKRGHVSFLSLPGRYKGQL
jgi:hypothetical protein